MPYNDSRQFPNSGALFDNDGGERGPAYSGNFTLDADVLQYVMQNAQSGSVQLRIAGWPRQGVNKNLISLRISIPQQQGNQGYQQPRGQPQYRQQQQPQQRQQPPAPQGYGYGQPAQRSNQSPQRPNPYAQASGRDPARPPQNNQYDTPPQSRRGTPENQRFRDELDDDLPPF